MRVAVAVAAVLVALPSAGRGQLPIRLTADFSGLGHSRVAEAPAGSQAAVLSVAVTGGRASFRFPTVLGEGRTILLNGASLEVTHLDFERWDPSVMGFAPERLVRLGYDLGVRRRFTGGWRLALEARPALEGDLESLDADDLRFEGTLLLERLLLSGWILGAGIYTGTAFDNEVILPALNARYYGISFQVDGELPRRLRLTYQPLAWLRIGIRGQVWGGRYGIRDSRAGGGGEVRFSHLEVGPQLQVMLGESFSIVVQGGAALRRRFAISGGDSGDVPLDPKRGGFWGIGLRFEGF